MRGRGNKKRNGAKESGCAACSYDRWNERKKDRKEREKTRVGIKWGGLLISLAIHPPVGRTGLPEGYSHA